MLKLGSATVCRIYIEMVFQIMRPCELWLTRRSAAGSWQELRQVVCHKCQFRVVSLGCS